MLSLSVRLDVGHCRAAAERAGGDVDVGEPEDARRGRRRCGIAACLELIERLAVVDDPRGAVRGKHDASPRTRAAGEFAAVGVDAGWQIEAGLKLRETNVRLELQREVAAEGVEDDFGRRAGSGFGGIGASCDAVGVQRLGVLHRNALGGRADAGQHEPERRE